MVAFPLSFGWWCCPSFLFFNGKQSELEASRLLFFGWRSAVALLLFSAVLSKKKKQANYEHQAPLPWAALPFLISQHEAELQGSGASLCGCAIFPRVVIFSHRLHLSITLEQQTNQITSIKLLSLGGGLRSHSWVVVFSILSSLVASS